MQCNATNRNGQQCRSHAVHGTSKCRMHGGSSLVGIASPTFRTGRYSKHLPLRLAERYSEALADPHLLELRDEIALMGTRQTELLDHLDSGLSLQRWKDAGEAYTEVMDAIAAKEPVILQASLRSLGDILDRGAKEYSVWEEIVALTEQRRRLVESEHKRQVAMQQMLTTEQAMALLAAITDIIRRNVADPTILAEIASALRAIVSIGAGQQP